MGRNGGHDHPFVVAPVGKWWGLFRVLPLATAAGYGAEPILLSWHVTQGAAEADAARRTWGKTEGQKEKHADYMRRKRLRGTAAG